MKEPFFGPNAIPLAVQMAAAVALWLFFSWIGVGELGRYAVCSVIGCSLG